MQAYRKSKLNYIVTGITGHLGNTVVRCLRRRGENIIGLLLPDEKSPFPDIDIVYGDITEKDSLRELFAYAKDSIVIHCAGKVSISSFDGLEMWNTNVVGTHNMVDLAMEYGVRKFIYVSSVHAIPEKPNGLGISEITDFRPENVVGDYAKTKSSATAYVLEAFLKGLPACIVHPSGIIGPYDPGWGQMSAVLQLYLKKRLPIGVDGGYDFVDVRDVAKGIVSCCENGKAGECYILSGHYYSVKTFLELAAKEVSGQAPRLYLPLKPADSLAALWEKISHKFGKTSVFTPYSLYTLGSNSNFTHKKASSELHYTVRDREETVRDMVRWTLMKMKYTV
ncbi:MAG: NAD-dependent epimerase/dehydratase family protein [Lachnospiraceae bacterium]|nr:NAD-dependent epimerase/dehydratase family protein [Lachnospiraceae bacterium]